MCQLTFDQLFLQSQSAVATLVHDGSAQAHSPRKQLLAMAVAGMFPKVQWHKYHSRKRGNKSDCSTDFPIQCESPAFP